MRKDNLHNVLSEEFVILFKRKVSSQFRDNISLSKKIFYYEFRKFCGRSFGLKKSETNIILDILNDYKIIELSSSGFTVIKKKFFNARWKKR